MGERTKIQWCATAADGTVYPGYTFNYWEGCTKVSPGCAHCYAEARNLRFHGGRNWGAGAPRRLSGEAYRRQPHKWNEYAQRIGVRLKVFGGSLMDWADNEVPGAWRTELWRIVRQTPNLDWLMLSKRIGNARSMLPADWGEGYPNVWLGATAVNQDEAARDLPKLYSIPAAVRWISLEPLLDAIDLGRVEGVECLQWVVIGGEWGAAARALSLDHARGVISQCAELRIPVFMKQFGARPVLAGRELHLRDRKGGDMQEWPEDLRVREYPIIGSPLAVAAA